MNKVFVITIGDIVSLVFIGLIFCYCVYGYIINKRG